MALPLPSGHTRRLIAEGAKGTAQTIQVMQEMVNSYKANNNVRKVCADAIQSCRPKDYYDYAKKCYEWVRDNIKYAYDPHLKEFCESPEKLLQNRIGDCDSQDMLLCSMFENLGFPAQYVTIKADPSRPDEYTHVYTRVKIPKIGWVVADPIMPEKWFGWEPPYPQGKKYWPASSDERSQPVDTSPSVRVDGPGQAPQPVFDLGISGLSGLSDLGRGGHGHHGGGRGRGGRWGGGYGWGPGYGYGYDEPDIYVLPVVVDGRVPTPDLVAVVPEEDGETQALENPAMDYSAGMGRMAAFGDGVFYTITNAVSTALNPIGNVIDTISSYATGSNLSTAGKIALATSVVDGSLARDINAKRAKLSTNSDLAYKYVQAAKKTNNSKALSAANAFAAAARDEQYALNDLVAKYNEVSSVINSASGGYYTPPKIGLNALPAVPITAVISTVAVSVALVALSIAFTNWSNKEANLEKARVDAVKEQIAQGIDKDTAARNVYGGAVARQAPGNEQSWGDYFNSFTSGSKDAIFKYALIIGGTFVAWQAFKYVSGIADSKIRAKLGVQ